MKIKKIRKFFFTINHLEIKSNFVSNLPLIKIKIEKNHYYNYQNIYSSTKSLHIDEKNNKNFIINQYEKKIKKEKIQFNRKSLFFNDKIRHIKTSFSKEINRIIFLKKKYLEFEENKKSLSTIKFRFYLYKQILNTGFGYILFYKIKNLKILNYLLLIFLLIYFEIDIIFFDYLLNPKIELSKLDLDNMHFIPKQNDIAKKIKENKISNSIIRSNEKEFINQHQDFLINLNYNYNKIDIDKDIDINKEIVNENNRNIINKINRLLFYFECCKEKFKFFLEKLKMIYMGDSYMVKRNLKNQEDVFEYLAEENKYDNNILNNSLIIRDIYSLMKNIKIKYKDFKYKFFDDKTFTFYLFHFFKLEFTYNFVKMTLNQKVKYLIEEFRNTEKGKKFLKDFDEKYNDLITYELKKYILFLFEDKNYRDILVSFLIRKLLENLYLRDLIIRVSENFLNTFLKSETWENVNI
jgi:hypothetical protein